MKKVKQIFSWRVFLTILLLILFSINNVLAQCPIERGIDSGEGHPDIDLTVRGWVGPTAGIKELIKFDRGLSGDKLYAIVDYGRAPQLSTLLAGKSRPAILNLYDVYHWDWESMSPTGIIVNSGMSDFASLVGFATSGQAVLVPSSGYEIGGGYEVMVVYATEDSVTIKYTGEDDMMWGYGLHIHGFNVDSELLALYRGLDAAGRESLPVLCSGQRLGMSTGGEIKVAIRDTGSFMDPRWEHDWWIAGPATENTSCLISTTTPLPTKCIDVPTDSSLGPAKCEAPTPSLTGEFRPYPCVGCDFADDDAATYSCGQPFTFIEQATYRCSDINPPSYQPADETCGNHIVRRSWDGDMKIDTSMSKVPFAGYHETLRGSEGYSYNTNLYLNDYFAGTLFYDGRTVGSNLNSDQWFLEVGVYRKLAPKELQDRLKIELIKGGYDYEITNGDETKNLQSFVGHYPPNLQDFIAEINEGDYESLNKYEELKEEKTIEWMEEYNDWQNNEWGELWAYVPMFVLEDAPATLELLIEREPAEAVYEDETGKRTSGRAKILGSDEEGYRHVIYPMSVPHLARLRDISEAMQELLSFNTQGIQDDNGAYNINSKNDYVLAAPSFSEITSQADVQSQVLGVSDRPECENGEDSGPGCIDTNAITNSDPKDPICCSGTLGVNFDDYIIEVEQDKLDSCNQAGQCIQCYDPISDTYSPQEPSEDNPVDCIAPSYCSNRVEPKFSEVMTRAVSVQFHVPYLQEIYENTIGPEGFYNIFKTDAFFEFFDEEIDPEYFQWPDTDARSNIYYIATAASIDNEKRELYFPYLGGINQTKKCISENFLAPYGLSGPSTNCDFHMADRSFRPEGGYGERPSPAYLGDCALLALETSTLAQIALESDCFDEFCAFIEDGYTNHYVPLGWQYDNDEANQISWEDFGDVQSIDGNVFELNPETEGKINDSDSPSACDYMLNLHASSSLYNSGFMREFLTADGLGRLFIRYSNKYALNAATANTQSIGITVDPVTGAITLTVEAHAYLVDGYDDDAHEISSDGDNYIIGQVCIEINGDRQCSNPTSLTTDANQPTVIEYTYYP